MKLKVKPNGKYSRYIILPKELGYKEGDIIDLPAKDESLIVKTEGAPALTRKEVEAIVARAIADARGY